MANEPIVNLPFLYINDLLVTTNVTTPNTKLSVSAGQCRDSTNVYDIVAAATTINTGVVGLNGIDTGTLGASSTYYVYVIADPSGFKITGTICSLNTPAAGGPLMPFGYGIYRLIGFAITDSSSHFLPFFTVGKSTNRYLEWDAPITVTMGTSTSYVAVDLSPAVPVTNFGRVSIQAAFTPNAASDTYNLQPSGGAGNAYTLTGQVASVVVNGVAPIIPVIVSGVPKIAYKVSAGTGAGKVMGFEFTV